MSTTISLTFFSLFNFNPYSVDDYVIINDYVYATQFIAEDTLCIYDENLNGICYGGDLEGRSVQETLYNLYNKKTFDKSAVNL